MKRVALCALSLAVGGTLVGCGSEPLPVTPAAVLIPNDPAAAEPVRVEPTNKVTFGPRRATPPGTEFLIKVITKAPADEIRIARCGRPCNTATSAMTWVPGAYRSGDELRWQADVLAQYYLWIRDLRNPAVSRAAAVTSEERVGRRLRMTFDTGAIYEAWFVTP